METDILSFLPDQDRKNVLSAAIALKVQNTKKLHPLVSSYEEYVDTYNSGNSSYCYGKSYSIPLRPWVFSSKSSHRIFKIVSALLTAVEQLGGSIDNRFNMCLRKISFSLYVEEMKKKVPHVLTSHEKKELKDYELAVKKGYSWSKPYIYQNDHVFSGELKFVIGDKAFRDTGGKKIEDQLGDMIIYMYYKSEEKLAQHDEDYRRAAITRNRIQNAIQPYEEKYMHQYQNITEEYYFEIHDIEKTYQLYRDAMDYKIACDIRAYIKAVSEKSVNDNSTSAWIAWAMKKADWYDPSIRRNDPVLGKRSSIDIRSEQDKFKEIKSAKESEYNKRVISEKDKVLSEAEINDFDERFALIETLEAITSNSSIIQELKKH